MAYIYDVCRYDNFTDGGLVFYEYNSPSLNASAVDEKPAFLLDDPEISVISPHIIPSSGNSTNSQHDANTTRVDPHMTGICDL
jgi:hypothetical protein